jgi:Kef-type K+ transport system membrane component KefB
MENLLPALFVIGIIATLSPLVTRIPIGFRLPIVVVEILLGIIVGPHVLGFVQAAPELKFFGYLGMVFLFFMAGAEIKEHPVPGHPLRMGTLGWVISLSIAVCTSFGLYIVGLVDAPLFVAVALTTTAMGALIPIMRDAHELETEFGKYVFGAGALGELGPIIAIPLIHQRHFELSDQVILMVGFIAAAVVSVYGASKVRDNAVFQFLSTWLQSNSQFAVRVSILILVGLVLLAAKFGLDPVLGSFAAGLIVALLSKGAHGEVLMSRMRAISYGFLVPAFFVTTGIFFNVSALFADPWSFLLLPLFLFLMLAIRGLAVLPAYKKVLKPNDRLPFALMTATALPLVVVITDIGVSEGIMKEATAAALVGAAMVTVLLFPIVALARRQHTTIHEVIEEIIPDHEDYTP